MKKNYIAHIEDYEDGLYHVSCQKELPFPCCGKGSSINEAVKNFSSIFDAARTTHKLCTGEVIDVKFSYLIKNYAITGSTVIDILIQYFEDWNRYEASSEQLNPYFDGQGQTIDQAIQCLKREYIFSLIDWKGEVPPTYSKPTPKRKIAAMMHNFDIYNTNNISDNIKKIHEIENEIEENISIHDKILSADNPRYAYTEHIAYLVYKKYPAEAMNIIFEFFLHCPEYKYPIYRKLLEWQKTKPF